MLQFDAASFVASNAFGMNGKQFPSHNRKMLGFGHGGPRGMALAPVRDCRKALLLVVEHTGPTMMARIGVMRTLNRHVERVFSSDRIAKTRIGESGSLRGTAEIKNAMNDRSFRSISGTQ